MTSFQLNYYFISVFKYLLPQDVFHLLEDGKIDTKTKNNYLKFLFFNYNNIKIKNIKFRNILSLIYNFVPLPNKFITSHLDQLPDHCINKRLNTYVYTGKKHGGDRIIPGNRILPNYRLCPIPFTFSYVKPNGRRTVTLSYTYYFEIKIAKFWIKPPWHHQCVSIGFGQKFTSTISKQVGWAQNTIGYHSDDGRIYNENSNSNLMGTKWGPGDIVGAGINYLNRDTVEFFFTLNGKLITKVIKNWSFPLIPLIGLDSTFPIYTNLGTDPFLYDPLKNNEVIHNNIISTKNLAMIKGYNNIFNYVQPSINIKNYGNIANINDIKKKIKITLKNPIFKNIIKNPFDLPKILDKWENIISTSLESEIPFMEEQITADSDDDNSDNSGDSTYSDSSDATIILSMSDEEN